MIYKLITKFYTKFSTYYENQRFFQIEKKNDKECNFSSEGFQILKKKNLIQNHKFFFNVKQSNSYMNKIIVPNKLIDELINTYFVKSLLFEDITKLTGFNYSIDFFTAYETIYIPNSDKENNVYANKWHSDKPYSRNTLKLIVPIETISNQDGGIEIINKDNSKKYFNNPYHEGIDNYFKMTGDTDTFLLFNPNLCLHRAGIPSKSKSRKQIMFQLNPSKKWSYSKNLYELQNRREPKFPIFYSRSKYYFF